MLVNERRTVAKLVFEHNGINPRTLLETASRWLGVDFTDDTDEDINQFRDYFADHMIAGQQLGQSLDDLIYDLVWGDLDEARLDDAAERAAWDLAWGRAKRLAV